MHRFNNLRSVGSQQVIEFRLDARIATWGDVVSGSLRQFDRGLKLVLFVVVIFPGEGLAHGHTCSPEKSGVVTENTGDINNRYGMPRYRP